MKSAIYTGTLSHMRLSPKKHQFTYKVFMVYAHLDEVEAICKKSIFWSHQRRYWFSSFCRSDFHGSVNISVKQAITNTLVDEVGRANTGDIFVLANWRYFGFGMNPLTTYYCFDKGAANPSFIVAEVTNTPWGERKAYVLTCDASFEEQCNKFEKKLHVSPFNPMNMEYRWRSKTPGKDLMIHLENYLKEEKVFSATLALNYQEITSKNLRGILIAYPVMTVKAGIAIYWQACRLWLKKIPIFNHPATIC